jgi:hypothetical protein
MNDKQLTIRCPACGEQISIQDALSYEIKETISQEAKEKAKKDLANEMKYLQEQNEKKEQKLEEARKNELELRKERNQLTEEKKDFELKKQRQIDAEREKIREITARELLEKQRFKDAEKDKVINDLKKALEDAQLKVTQGSQQTQGEVQELDLEKELKESFPTDEIQEIKKGERGADIRHIVKTAKGNLCGIILWESKRTKSWKNEFVEKLKEDLRTTKANIPIIVTTVMPKETKNPMYFKDCVWICTYSFVIILAELVRQRLFEVAREKFIIQHQGTKAEELYTYIMGFEFRQQIEAIIESYVSMKSELTKERRAFETIWKNREEQMEKLVKSTARIVGSVSGKVGSEFPPVKGLELLESGEKNN